ncbi:MAG: DNA primase [Aureispira sp.]
MINKNFIDRLLSKADIEYLAPKLVPDLKKSGANLVAKSPFTDEKTGSFYVSPAKQIFKCFSSGNGGNIVTLSMQVKTLSYPQAIEWIAEQMNEEVQYDHQSKEEREEYLTQQERYSKLLRSVSKRLYLGLDENVKQHLAARKVTEEEISLWGLGYGTADWEYLSKSIIETGYFTEAKDLFIINNKAEKTYDRSRGKITITLHSDTGRVVGFAYRQFLEEGGAKYINPTDGPLFKKNEYWYGMHLAKKEIRNRKHAFIVEGYFDVQAMHRVGITNTIAGCGTSITDGQIKILLRCNIKHFVLLLDGDDAGTKSALRHIPLFIERGAKVSVISLPNGQDPDDFLRDKTADQTREVREQLKKLQKDGLEWWLRYKLETLEEDGDTVAEEAMLLLAKMEGQHLLKGRWEEMVAKLCRTKLKDLRVLMKSLQADVKEEVQELKEGDVRLPKGADRAFYDKHQFCFNEHGYHFYHPNAGHVKQGTNFTIIPHFHIQSRIPGENKRLMTIKNHREEILVELESSALVSFPKFKQEVWDYGNFGFKAGTNTNHFDMLRDYLGDAFVGCKPLNVLGQQPEGFFAFSNGIVNETGEFHAINDFGIVKHTDQYTDVMGEDVDHEQHYYLPAFSKLNKGVRSDEDDFETERKLVYKESSVSFSQWMKLFMDAFGKEKGMIGLSWLIASCFRSMFIKDLLFFPLLFGYGETGSGKSMFGKVLQNFFFYKQQEFSLKSGTDSGMSRRLGQVNDAVVFLDEFNEFITEDRFNHLKNGWGGIGREIGRATHNNKTRTIKVTLAMYLAGQYMSSLDDHALTNRSVLLEFLTTSTRPQKQVEAFNKIKDLMNEGVSSLVAEIIKFRPQMQEVSKKGFNQLKNELREEMKGMPYVERVMDNFCVLMSTVKALESYVQFPFTYAEFKELCQEKILHTSDLIGDTEGVAQFWRVIERLNQNHEIIRDRDYSFECPETVGIREDKRKSTERWKNLNDKNEPETLLYLNWNNVYERYKNDDKKAAIDRSTLKGMLANRKEVYVGRTENHEFSKYGKTTALVFKYSALQKKGINLKNSNPIEPDELENIKEQVKAPF